jgi:geranylgeranyl diphosphate synthase, type II
MEVMSKADWQTCLLKYFPLTNKVESSLLSASQECLKSDGGYFRADLTATIATSLGLKNEIWERIAVAIEYYHLSSLILDDMPCMDNASYRRGKICIHRKYGEANAILLSLSLINRAYALIWEATLPENKNICAAVNSILDKNLGLNGVINGQALDLTYPKDGRDAMMIEDIAMGKTSSIMNLPLMIPALLAGVGSDEQDLLEKISQVWGLHYQLLDDLKDAVMDLSQVGKQCRQDQLQERPNMVLAVGYSESIARIESLRVKSGLIINELKSHRNSWEVLDTFYVRFANMEQSIRDYVAVA